MAKKIKHFKVENFKPEELQKIEDDIKGYVSEDVERYIKENKLYF